MTIDDVTFLVWICSLPPYAAREWWTLRNREHPISVVARARGWLFTAFIYFWSSMPIHWHVPSPFHPGAPGGIAFWTIQGVILAWNVIVWRAWGTDVKAWPKWLVWINWPVWYVVGGALAAWTLFPQNQMLPWSL